MTKDKHGWEPSIYRDFLYFLMHVSLVITTSLLVSPLLNANEVACKSCILNFTVA